MCWLCVFILLTSSCVVMHNFLPIMKMLGQLKMNIYFTLWGCCWIYFWLRSLPESNEASLPGSVAMVMTCWWVCCTSQWRFFHGRASVQNQLQHELCILYWKQYTYQLRSGECDYILPFHISSCEEDTCRCYFHTLPPPPPLPPKECMVTWFESLVTNALSYWECGMTNEIIECM